MHTWGQVRCSTVKRTTAFRGVLGFNWELRDDQRQHSKWDGNPQSYLSVLVDASNAVREAIAPASMLSDVPLRRIPARAPDNSASHLRTSLASLVTTPSIRQQRPQESTKCSVV